MLAENSETGEVAYKTVLETYENEANELVHVHVNGEIISATLLHPFYVNQFGWTRAAELRAGDILVLSNGEYVVVEFVQHEILENPVKVYNFEVEDYHTYFVGESSVLVHNGCEDEDLLTWNEFQAAHKGEYTNEEMSAAWAQYKKTNGIGANSVASSQHGNSLSYEGTNYGYVLKDKTTGEVLKYGESINPNSRYTKAYLDENNAMMIILTEGTKREVHQWQIDFNNIYKQFTGEYPRLTVYGN